MEDLISRVWENLIDRTHGPMHLRFFLQPAMSIFFAIRAGIKDAKNNTHPYLWRMFITGDSKREIAKEGWKDYGKIFFMGVTLDVIYQLIVVYKLETSERFYPLESLLVAATLAIVPYLLLRGPTSRVVRMFLKR
jgi:hypothetical protein